VVARLRGRVFNRASSNRIDMCGTEPKCRSVLLQRQCSLGSSFSKRSAAANRGHASYELELGARLTAGDIGPCASSTSAPTIRLYEWVGSSATGRRCVHLVHHWKRIPRPSSPPDPSVAMK
jgi:hypothetical protein